MPKSKNARTWPKPGQDIFAIKSVGMDSPTLAALQWLSDLHASDSWLADAFKTSADRLIYDLRKRKGPEHADIYFFPIGYLYRHALELKLKQVVRLAIKLELIESTPKIQGVLAEHGLYPLWNHAKSSLIRFWPEGPKGELSAAERVIQSMHIVDGAGQNLRYTKNKHGRSTFAKMPKYIELVHFQKVFSGVYNMLGGCEDAFENACQNASEAS